LKSFDAVIIGSGPNGLSASIRLAQAGFSVLVVEGSDTIGGGTRSAELTLPGFTHDICAAIHPLGLASPYLRKLPLHEHGLEWIQPDAPLAQVMDEGTVVIEKDLDATAEALGADGKIYRKMMAPMVRDWDALMEDFLGPLPMPPKHPIAMTRFGLLALRSAKSLAGRFQGAKARAAFAGMAGHSIMPLEWPLTAAFGLMLADLAHAVGWPVSKGGSQNITNAMASYLKSMGGEIRTGEWISSLDSLPPSRVLLFDLTPRGLLKLAGGKLHTSYKRQLENYQYGPGVCKVDWALDGPIPWRDPATLRAGTVHVGGTFEEVAAAEAEVWKGKHPEKPFVLVAQQSLFDPSRAPKGKHTGWAYCHVPNGSTRDVSDLMERQIERFAPGFSDRILAKSAMTAMQMEAYNPNYIGGDINGGVQDWKQLFTRPAVQWNPYRVPGDFGKLRAYLCSSATPPGGGVHGMCGFYAAESAINYLSTAK